MDIPGLNPLNPRIPSGQSGAVPDLILNVPGKTRPQAPGPMVEPNKAPLQPQIQHSTQSLMNALVEMSLQPTPQNLQIAQQLANYGQPVNQRNMQIVQGALARVPDKSQAAIEATVVLLVKELPVTPEHYLS